VTSSPPDDRYFELDGIIAAAGFGSGDRVVVGHWAASPIGPFSDIMWAEPDDWRTLFVADERAKAFVTAVYEFDSVIVVPSLSVRWAPSGSSSRLDASWTGAEVSFNVGRALPFPPRPNWITQRIEAPIARTTMKVETYGVSPTGVYEWYRTKRLRRITDGWAVVSGNDLGPIGPPTPTCGFGFSEPPPFASLTEVTPRLHDPSRRLDALIDELGGTRS
jgi:hypothetical protein